MPPFPALRRRRAPCSSWRRRSPTASWRRGSPTSRSAASSRAEVVSSWAAAGLLGLPYPEEYGGGGQPYEVYLQVLEVLASRWLAVAEACQRAHARLLSAGRVRHATRSASGCCPPCSPATCWARTACPSRGWSDAAALTTRAVRDGDEYLVSGTKAWITHAGRADFYNVFCRTGGPGAGGISCLLAAPAHAGHRAAGRRADDGSALLARGADRLRRRPGAAPTASSARRAAASRSRWRALDGGRLGIAACAVGLAQAALDYAVGVRPGAGAVRPARSIEFQGIGFMLADMATQVSAARALTLAAARLRDAGRPYRRRRRRRSCSPRTWRCG